MGELGSMSESGGGRVIDLRTGNSGVRRILELAGPGSDPGWIAGVLNREGHPSPTHRPWSPEDVLAVLGHRHGTRA
jgi:hypothetical protein